MKFWKAVLIYIVALFLVLVSVAVFAEKVAPTFVESGYTIYLPDERGSIVCIPLLEVLSPAGTTPLACTPVINTELCLGFDNADIDCPTLTGKSTGL